MYTTMPADHQVITLAPRSITALNPLRVNDFVYLVSDNNVRGTVIKASGRNYNIQIIPSMEVIEYPVVKLYNLS